MTEQEEDKFEQRDQESSEEEEYDDIQIDPSK